MASKILTVLLITITGFGCSLASDWHYENQEGWSETCQTGKRQSPIELTKSYAESANFTQLEFFDYDRYFRATMKNNGHSAELRLDVEEHQKPEIEGGNLTQGYVLDHLHFHWQSEHTIDNYRFPLEVHLVHYAKSHMNLTNALDKPEGIAVFAVLFDLSPDDDIEFQPLLEIVNKLLEPTNAPFNLDAFSVKSFVPRDTAGYFRYHGSLTTPKCNEGVLWTVFTNTIPISKKQVAIFEEMRTNHKTKLLKNYRELQPLNGRRVLLRVSPLRSAAKCYRSYSFFSHVFMFLLIKLVFGLLWF